MICLANLADEEELEKRRAFLAVSDGVLGAAVLLVLGVYGGAWLDTKLHTTPWLSIGLSMLGGCLGLARMVVRAAALDTKIDKAGLKSTVALSGRDKCPLSGESGAPAGEDSHPEDVDEQN